MFKIFAVQVRRASTVSLASIAEEPPRGMEMVGTARPRNAAVRMRNCISRLY